MITLIWNRKGLQFVASDEAGHQIIVDTDIESGGFNQGFKPMELLLVALAGCMGMDIVSILQKKGGKIDSFKMVLKGEKNPEHPRRYLKIIYEIECKGEYRREDLIRSFELSRDKYCSVLATLKNPPEFEFNLL
ncbi:MAG: OsmC family protein [candidate division WOR-3 bacterium]|nr:OsmC family protein [candidate division WOR-3 bacterium]